MSYLMMMGSQEAVQHTCSFARKGVVCKLTYTITPGAPEPVMIERMYTAPQARQDQIMLRPLTLNTEEQAEFRALVEGSRVHTDRFEPWFYNNNQNLCEEQLRAGGRKRMAIFYRGAAPGKWRCIGQVGFNDHRHTYNGKSWCNEPFIWRGDTTYLATQGIATSDLKGAMHAAAKGFGLYSFASDPQLPALCAYTDKDNVPTQKLLEAMGCLQKEQTQGYNLHGAPSHYLIYELSRQRYEEAIKGGGYAPPKGHPSKGVSWVVQGLFVLVALGLLGGAFFSKQASSPPEDLVEPVADKPSEEERQGLEDGEHHQEKAMHPESQALHNAS